ncbi:MAG: hypothetical protein ACSHXK_06260 [Oceanococcus sp.]
MSVRVSATTIFCIVSLFGVSSALHAQTVGADRIYAAEAKAAALKAQNEQLAQSVATQSAALKRLDDEINLMRQDHELQLKNLQSVQAAELSSLRDNTSAQNTALRETNASMSVQIKRLMEQSSQQAQNESMLDNQARAAQAEATKLQNLVNEQSTQIANLTAQMDDLRSNLAAQQQTISGESERLRAQMKFMQERNSTLQEALSSAPAADQLQALKTALEDAQLQLAANNSSQQDNIEQTAAMQSALNTANAQIQQDAQEIATLRTALNDAQASLNQASSMQSALNTANSQTALDAAQLESEHLALQTEYNQILDGVRSCEARLQNANQAAATAKQQPTQASSHPEDIRRIAELESALDRANIEIRNANKAFEEELNLERAMAAGSEVELEQQFQKRINAMQEALQSCRAG